MPGLGGSEFGKGSKKGRKLPTVTHRFNLTLFPPTKRSNPSFNYKDLVRERQGGHISDDDRFEDNEEKKQMQAIVSRLEQTYKNEKGGKRVRVRAEDLMDLGMGYDKDDPFIDDAEEYDELVPSCLDTEKGGFYVNDKTLTFQQIIDDSTDETDTEHKSPKKRKKEKKVASPKRRKMRAISSDDEDNVPLAKSVPSSCRESSQESDGTASPRKHISLVVESVIEKSREGRLLTPTWKKNKSKVGGKIESKAGKASMDAAKKIKKRSLDVNPQKRGRPPLTPQKRPHSVMDAAAGKAKKPQPSASDPMMQSILNVVGGNQNSLKESSLIDFVLDENEGNKEDEIVRILNSSEEVIELDTDGSSKEAKDIPAEKPEIRMVGRPPTGSRKPQAGIPAISFEMSDKLHKRIANFKKFMGKDQYSSKKMKEGGDTLLLDIQALFDEELLNQRQKSSILKHLTVYFNCGPTTLNARLKTLADGGKPLVTKNLGESPTVACSGKNVSVPSAAKSQQDGLARSGSAVSSKSTTPAQTPTKTAPVPDTQSVTEKVTRAVNPILLMIDQQLQKQLNRAGNANEKVKVDFNENLCGLLMRVIIVLQQLENKSSNEEPSTLVSVLQSSILPMFLNFEYDLNDVLLHMLPNELAMKFGMQKPPVAKKEEKKVAHTSASVPSTSQTASLKTHKTGSDSVKPVKQKVVGAKPADTSGFNLGGVEFNSEQICQMILSGQLPAPLAEEVFKKLEPATRAKIHRLHVKKTAEETKVKESTMKESEPKVGQSTSTSSQPKMGAAPQPKPKQTQPVNQQKAHESNKIYTVPNAPKPQIKIAHSTAKKSVNSQHQPLPTVRSAPTPSQTIEITSASVNPTPVNTNLPTLDPPKLLSTKLPSPNEGLAALKAFDQEVNKGTQNKTSATFTPLFKTPGTSGVSSSVSNVPASVKNAAPISKELKNELIDLTASGQDVKKADEPPSKPHASAPSSSSQVKSTAHVSPTTSSPSQAIHQPWLSKPSPTQPHPTISAQAHLPSHSQHQELARQHADIVVERYIKHQARSAQPQVHAKSQQQQQAVTQRIQQPAVIQRTQQLPVPQKAKQPSVGNPSQTQRHQANVPQQQNFSSPASSTAHGMQQQHTFGSPTATSPHGVQQRQQQRYQGPTSVIGQVQAQQHQRTTGQHMETGASRGHPYGNQSPSCLVSSPSGAGSRNSPVMLMGSPPRQTQRTQRQPHGQQMQQFMATSPQAQSYLQLQQEQQQAYAAAAAAQLYAPSSTQDIARRQFEAQMQSMHRGGNSANQQQNWE